MRDDVQESATTTVLFLFSRSETRCHGDYCSQLSWQCAWIRCTGEAQVIQMTIDVRLQVLSAGDGSSLLCFGYPDAFQLWRFPTLDKYPKGWRLLESASSHVYVWFSKETTNDGAAYVWSLDVTKENLITLGSMAFPRSLVLSLICFRSSLISIKGKNPVATFHQQSMIVLNETGF